MAPDGNGERAWEELEKRLNEMSPTGGIVGHYDRAGKPIGLGTWARLYRDHAYVVVKQTRLTNGYKISTVWLGLDHRFGVGAPLIFETMVFRKRSSMEIARREEEAQAQLAHAKPDTMESRFASMQLRSAAWDESDLECERYSTEEEALAGHERMVAQWQRRGLVVVKDEEVA